MTLQHELELAWYFDVLNKKILEKNIKNAVMKNSDVKTYSYSVNTAAFTPTRKKWLQKTLVKSCFLERLYFSFSSKLFRSYTLFLKAERKIDDFRECKLVLNRRETMELLHRWKRTIKQLETAKLIRLNQSWPIP